jgi:hypothetical protein
MDFMEEMGPEGECRILQISLIYRYFLAIIRGNFLDAEMSPSVGSQLFANS